MADLTRCLEKGCPEFVTDGFCAEHDAEARRSSQMINCRALTQEAYERVRAEGYALGREHEKMDVLEQMRDWWSKNNLEAEIVHGEHVCRKLKDKAMNGKHDHYSKEEFEAHLHALANRCLDKFQVDDNYGQGLTMDCKRPFENSGYAAAVGTLEAAGVPLSDAPDENTKYASELWAALPDYLSSCTLTRR